MPDYSQSLVKNADQAARSGDGAWLVDIGAHQSAEARSGARTPSHWPTIPPFDRPQKETVCIEFASSISITSRPSPSIEYRPVRRSDRQCGSHHRWSRNPLSDALQKKSDALPDPDAHERHGVSAAGAMPPRPQ